MAKEDSTLSICLPGETGWELWKQGGSNATLSQVAPLDEGGNPASFKQADVLAYPVLASFVLPTVAQTSDEELIADVVAMNLEKNGMKADTGPGRLVKTRVVDREENRSLAITSLLHEQVTPTLPAQRPTHYELSPFFYYLPDDSLVLWKELGKLVVCVTKRDNPVYFQALTSEELDDGAIQELENLLMPLDFQGVASDVKQIVIWTETTPEARQALANALHLPLKAEKRPNPSFAGGESSYEPTAVALAKIREAKMRRIRNIVAVCAGVYVAGIAALVGIHLVRLNKNKELQRQADSLKVIVANVQPAFDTWNATAAVRDKDGFVAETARRIMESVSGRVFQMKINSVKISTEKAAVGTDATEAATPGEAKKRIEIKAEAKSQNFAAQFRNHLNNNPETKRYDWAAPSYDAMRGDLHPFTIIGSTRKEAE